MDLSQQIYTVLVKRKYNRGKPFLAEKILDIIKTSVENDEPIKLVGFWGTGPKDAPNWADKESCDFLNDLNKEIQEIYKPGIEFTFIFANSHGIHNGYESERISSYIRGITTIFDKGYFPFP